MSPAADPRSVRRGPASRLGIGASTFPHRRWSGAGSRAYGPPMRRSLGTAAASLALAVLVGCSGPGAESGGADGGAGGGSVVPGEAEGAPSGPEEADPERQVVTTATASVA